ncbi:MAG: SDR family NAD(P)-dependent oxidoreductase [Moraxellaceae bacterium]|nr:MAG: SDR family NAD(P)-dependent oxidoreductase [Moraxellaceae bacterium]
MNTKNLTAADSRQPCAIVIGVGASQGIGAAVCRRIGREGLLVYVVGRTQEKLDGVVAEIQQAGGQAESYILDATKAGQVEALFGHIISTRQQRIDLVVHNVGSNMPSRFLKSSLNFFDSMWRFTFLSGFLVSQQAVKAMQQQGQGTLIFTGASASIRGKPYFAAFTTGKAALRTYAQGLAKELNPQNIHIAHVVVDGMVDGERINQAVFGLGRLLRKTRGSGGLNIEAIAENYWMLHQQAKPLWTHELDLRPYSEKF